MSSGADWAPFPILLTARMAMWVAGEGVLNPRTIESRNLLTEPLTSGSGEMAPLETPSDAPPSDVKRAGVGARGRIGWGGAGRQQQPGRTACVALVSVDGQPGPAGGLSYQATSGPVK